MTQNSASNLSAGAPSTPRQKAQAMVSAAAAAYKTGDLALAEQLLIEATEIVPGHADALQLLGLLAKSKGDTAGAEKLLVHSLKSDPNQPHVHNNLANLLKARGAVDEAQEHYTEAVRLNPNYVEAMTALGECLMLLERLDQAEAPLKTALRLRPGDVSARLALAEWQEVRGRKDEAERLLREGLALSPGNPFFNNNLGKLLTEQMRFAEAWECLSAVVPLAGNQSLVMVNAGNCLVGLGRLQDAANHFLKAIDLDPLNYRAHENLNKILWEMGRGEDVGKSFLFAKQAIPHHPDILEMAAETAIFTRKFDEAEADLAEAAMIRPGSPSQFRLQTQLRIGQHRPAEALAVAREGLRRYPGDIELLRKSCDAAFMADQPEAALDSARKMTALDRFSQFAIAYEATALRLLGETEAAGRLYDYQRLINAAELAPPAPYQDLAAFHGDLIPALEVLHHASKEPSYQSLRGGTQTHENLFDRPGVAPPIRLLGEAVMAAVERLAAGLPEDAGHPFLARRLGRKRWSGSWSVRLGESGHHIDHIHPEGWLSGCYYVDMPPCLADEAAKQGWIKFGEYRPAVGQSLPWEKAVKPYPGLLVLFPSYMWHGTIPITGPDKRLTVAFDIAVDA